MNNTMEEKTAVQLNPDIQSVVQQNSAYPKDQAKQDQQMKYSVIIVQTPVQKKTDNEEQH